MNTGRSKALLAGLVVVGLVDLAFLNLHAAPRYLAELEGEGSTSGSSVAAGTPATASPKPAPTADEPSAVPVASAEPAGEGGAESTAEPTATAVAVADEPPSSPAQPAEPTAASGKPPVIAALNFGSGSIELGQRSRALLFDVAKYMRSTAGQSVLLQGHADERGTEAVNEALSLQRARAAAAYLIELGVSKERVQITGVGERMPVDRGDSAASLARNRRVVVIWQ